MWGKMNWLFLIESVLAGIIAGLVSSCFADSIDSWNILSDFKTALFMETAFCGLFCGLVYSFPFLISEKIVKKFFSRFFAACSLGALMGAIGVVAFKFIVDYSSSVSNFTGSSGRFFMWVIPAISLSMGLGFVNGGIKCIIRALMSFTPTFVIIGFIVNRLPAEVINKTVVFALIGLICGFAFALIYDFLKSSWLDEDVNSFLVCRYYLDNESFWIGSSYDCDLTVKKGEEVMVQINEKDGVHILEAEEKSEVSVNSMMAKYRVLQEGDKVSAYDRTFIYHTNMMRVQDTVPNEMAGI